MMLSNKCKYALKALVILAAEGTRLSSSLIAAKARVPEKFLEAILRDLRHAGTLVSTRGAQGGHALSAAPETIRLGAVVRAIDGMLAPLPCASTFYYSKCADCVEEDICVIRHAMLEVRNKISEVLDSMSLADLVNMSPRKRQKIFW
ncbi:MAG TPA: Rrf2 family transcriptional regulator [Patescibacteria group bacterium]|nr:Rrf2 family transcriptional regulator [Patescibacteria group bacterium]